MFKSKCSQCKFNTITLDVTDQEKYGHDCHVESDYIEFANMMNKCLNCKYGYRLFSIPWFRTKSQFESRNENE